MSRQRGLEPLRTTPSTWSNPLADEVNAVAPADEGHSGGPGNAVLEPGHVEPRAGVLPVLPSLAEYAVTVPRSTGLVTSMSHDGRKHVTTAEPVPEIQPQAPLCSPRSAALAEEEPQAQRRRSMSFEPPLPPPPAVPPAQPAHTSAVPALGVRSLRPPQAPVYTQASRFPRPHTFTAVPEQKRVTLTADDASTPAIDVLLRQNAELNLRLDAMEDQLRRTQSQMSMMSSSFFAQQPPAAMALPPTHGSIMGAGPSMMIPSSHSMMQAGAASSAMQNSSQFGVLLPCDLVCLLLCTADRLSVPLPASA